MSLDRSLLDRSLHGSWVIELTYRDGALPIISAMNYEAGKALRFSTPEAAQKRIEHYGSAYDAWARIEIRWIP